LDKRLLAFGGARAALFLVVGLGVLGAFATVAQMALLARVVDRVLFGDAGLSTIGGVLSLLAVAVVARAGVLWLREACAGRGAARVKADLRERLFEHLMRLGPAYTGGERAGELVSAVTEGTERLDAYFARYLPQVTLSAFVPLIVAAYIFPTDWASAVLLLVTVPVIPILMVLVGSYAEEHINKQWFALSRLSAQLLDSMQGLPTLRLFGRAATERERIERLSEGFRLRTLKVLRYAFLSGLVLEFMTAVAIGLVAVTLGVRLVNGSVGFEEAFVVLLLAPEFYRPLRELGAHRHAGMEGKAAAERIFDILDTPIPETMTGECPPSDTGAPTLSLRGVNYRYPDGSGNALDGLDLDLAAGETTALVGPSGAGKSTVVDLLLRFREPESGELLADGSPVSALPSEVWRERVALVPQRPHLFYGSVLENIRLARPGATREEVEHAAELAGAADFVDRLPRGYDTPVGEEGAFLSGGEARRVAVARALLKDAPVLVLDEPTASLDPESERLISTALTRLSRGRTVLVVAHRMGTARRADRLAFLEGGRVVESGDHDSLVAADGRYARFLEAYRGAPA
jgi:ATP-binding cassette, subfamily C, bacterial CydD